MFSPAKFLSLPERNRLRYLWRWARDAEASLAEGRCPVDCTAQLDVLTRAGLCQDPPWDEASVLAARLSGLDLTDAGACRAAGAEWNRLGHQVAALCGQEAAEWDLREGLWQTPAGDSAAMPCSARRLAYLDGIRSPFNVGSIFRTAEVFGLGEVLLSPECPSLDHPRLVRSAMGCEVSVPHRRMDFQSMAREAQESGLPIFALELGGARLGSVPLPREGIVVLGSEELGVDPKILEACDASGGRFSIPVLGRKASLNVSVSFGILAHAWAAAGI